MKTMERTKLIEIAKKQYPQEPMIVEIYSESIDHFAGNSKATGKPFEINKQAAYLHDPQAKYPKEFQIQAKDKESPIKKGFYVLNLTKSIAFDNYGSLIIDSRSLNLLPIVDF